MSETKSKIFRLEEVKQNKNSKSTWVIIHNSVYNVTEFLNEHPGGEEVLLEQAGRDASEAFEDVGHSSDAREMMEKYKIGELAEEDRVKTDRKPQAWGSDPSSSTSKDNNWNAWLIPVVIGIVATVLYKFFLTK
uniref:Cytochrome b5 n=2 Tax=Lygus hesperus TaxID=30085 RepID=A0A0A9WVI7_LYGHE